MTEQQIKQFDPFRNKVRETISKYGMLTAGDRVVVAVSGGPDSLCLLSVLNDLASELSLSLHVAHLDHMFRGEESAREAQFVSTIARGFGIPATIEQADVPRFCRERGLSVQAGAREVRYAFLHRVADQATASRIATGHTASDQAETFLLRLIRGAGASGLAAIPPVRGSIIRPLLERTREEVVEYLDRNGIGYATDPSNLKPVYSRNRIRLELIPVLKKFNPRIVERLAAEAALLRDEDEAMDACLNRMVSGILQQQGEGVTVERKGFNLLPTALKRRALRTAMTAAGLAPGLFSSVRIDEALDFISSSHTGRVMHLEPGFTLEREYDRFVIGKRPQPELFCEPLTVPGVTVLAGLGLHVETRIESDKDQVTALSLQPGINRDSAEDNYLWQAVFDYDKITTGLTVRTRQAGDWFCPSGMAGKSKKLQDFFVDMKVPRPDRDRVPLLAAGEDIIWVGGYRTDQRFLPGEETEKLLVVRFRERQQVTRE